MGTASKLPDDADAAGPGTKQSSKAKEDEEQFLLWDLNGLTKLPNWV